MKPEITILKERCIGLTGAIATGKSTVAKIILNFGYRVIDADQLARDVTQIGSKTLASLVTLFGASILEADGSLHRSNLRAIVLASESKRKDLESIMHPAIQECLLQKLHALPNDGRPIFYEAALIHETNRAGLFREIWCTYCPEEVQLARLIARPAPKVSEDEAKRLIAAQWSAKKKADSSTRVIDTHQPPEAIARQVKQFIEILL